MDSPPIPVVFEPIFKLKPWGGRELERLFGKKLPGDGPIGESWEVADLPDNESRVASGPLAGRRLAELVASWGSDLLGSAAPAAGRFPLLIKFLDARERLSIQTHPRAAADGAHGEPPGVKHEAWYVIGAEPDAELYIGLKAGVGPEDVRAAGSTPALAELLQRWPGRPGRCYHLPSGVPHALGAGLLVAEIQTPSDVTYRLYDWGRVGLDGRPRELHFEQALANMQYDVPAERIAPPRRHTADMLATITRLVMCERFAIDRLRFCEGYARELPGGELAIWIVLAGSGALLRQRYRCAFRPGDVVLVPARTAGTRVEVAADCTLLEVKIPAAYAPGRAAE